MFWPTQKGYDMGFFKDEQFHIPETHTVVVSKFDNKSFLFTESGVICNKKSFVIVAKKLLEIGDSINIVRSICCVENLEDFEIFISENQ